MIVRSFILSLIVMLCAFPAYAADKVYNAQTATLKNGLELIVVPVHRTPAVTHMIWYRAGAGEEAWGQSGIAHFLEHLMFKGTPNVPPGEFSKRVKRMGGNDNAFTSWDYTAYFQTIPADRLKDVMIMEAERMNDMTPKLSDVLSEKQVVIEERRQTLENDPSALLGERMRQALFPNHPYGRPIIGWKDETARMKWVDSLAFYRQWYAPDNAVVVISGDVTMDDVLPMVEATYGRLNAEHPPRRVRPMVPLLNGDVVIKMHHDNVKQPAWQKIIRVPSARQNSEESLALTLLDNLLGGATGVLYQRLVVEDKIATYAGAGYTPYAWNDTTFTLYATPADGVSLQDLAKAVDGVLQETLKKGFTDEEVKTAITQLQDEAVYALDSLAGPAMNIGYARATGVSLDDVEYWPARIEAVTKENILKVLQKHVLNGPAVSGLLLPKQDEGAVQ